MKTERHTYASLKSRTLAALIDMSLSLFVQCGLIFYLSISQANNFDDFVVKAYLYLLNVAIVLSLPLMYLYLYSIEKWGGTPGKIISGLQIVSQAGTFISKKDAFFREVVYKPISYAPFGLGVFAALKNDKKQTWHDEMAGTYVVQKQDKQMISAVIAFVLIAAIVYTGYMLYNLGVSRELF